MTYTSQNFYYSPPSQGMGTAGAVTATFPHITGTPLFGFDPWSLAISGAIMGVTALIGHFKRRGAQKVAATQIVEEGSRLLQQNLDAWNSSSKTVAEQQTVLQNFDQVWSEIVAACQNEELGSAGERCISERQQGSTAQCYINGVLGNCDFFAKFRDPIANDPNVRPETLAEQALPSNLVDAQGNPLFDLQQVGLAAAIIIASLVVPRFL